MSKFILLQCHRRDCLRLRGRPHVRIGPGGGLDVHPELEQDERGGRRNPRLRVLGLPGGGATWPKFGMHFGKIYQFYFCSNTGLVLPRLHRRIQKRQKRVFFVFADLPMPTLDQLRRGAGSGGRGRTGQHRKKFTHLVLPHFYPWLNNVVGI